MGFSPESHTIMYRGKIVTSTGLRVQVLQIQAGPRWPILGTHSRLGWTRILSSVFARACVPCCGRVGLVVQDDVHADFLGLGEG